MISDQASLPELFRSRVQRHPEQPAILSGEREVTFAEIDASSDRVAAWLAGREVVKGDRIALYCINSDAFAVAYLGIVKAGAVVVPVNLLIGVDEVKHVLSDSGAKGIFYFELLAEKVAAFREGIEGLEFAASIGASPAPAGDASWPEVLGTEGAPPEVDFNPKEDLAAILYTSGTTGYPKGAMLTHRNLAANTWSVNEALGLVPGEDSLLVVLPMFHAFAATAGLLFPLLHGYTIVPLTKFDPQQVVETIAARKVSVFLGVPSMFSVLLRLPDKAAPLLGSLKYAISGGAAMPAEVMKQFEAKFGKAIYEGDGPTECGPVTCFNPIGGLRKPYTVGQSVPGVEMKIVDEEGRDAPHGEIGEICVRGPNVMKGYWKRPEETAAAFLGEWFRTGDLGTEDEDGYFAIVDRKKDLIIVNGMNVYPRMIEEALYEVDGVREAAVLGEPSRLHGEIPVAYVSLKEGAETTDSDLRSFCVERLGRHQVPKRFHIIPDLPKNATGKIMKRELRKDGEQERGVEHRPAE